MKFARIAIREEELQEISIPTLDITPFLQPAESNEAVAVKRKSLLKEISKAFEEWGFVRIINHGMNVKLWQEAFKMAEGFFALPEEEKLKVRPGASSPYPTGFSNTLRSQGVRDDKEILLFLLDESTTDVSRHQYTQHNVWPQNPPQYRSVIEETIKDAEKTMKWFVGIVSQSLGLPSDLLWNVEPEKLNLFIMNYYAARGVEGKQGLGHHTDGGIISMAVDNDVEAYQILKDNTWITLKPIPDSVIFNVGDTLKVWSNGRYPSVLHRASSPNTHQRLSIVFDTAPGYQARLAPLPQLTSQLAIPPRYREFVYGEYMKLRFKNKDFTNPNAKEFGVDDFLIQSPTMDMTSSSCSITTRNLDQVSPYTSVL